MSTLVPVRSNRRQQGNHATQSLGPQGPTGVDVGFGLKSLISKIGNSSFNELIGYELAHDQPLIQSKSETQRESATAEQNGASRPSDPGVGEGIDVIFILTSAPGDAETQKDFIEGMTSYVRNVLHADNVFEVKGLNEMFEILDAQGKYGEKRVRRIRIVGHGFEGAHGGKVLTRDSETKTRKGRKSTLITPSEVRKFAELPQNRDTIARVMEPNAVVEFWGCNLGNYPEAGEAWADLFHSTFMATKEKMVARFFSYSLKGSDGRKQARSSRDVDRAGPRVTAEFNQFLLRTYKNLIAMGEIVEVSDDPRTIIAWMREMFDRSSGELSFMAVQESRGKHRYITPDKTEPWNTAWITYPQLPIEAPADQNAATSAEEELAPPTVSSHMPISTEAANPGITPSRDVQKPISTTELSIAEPRAPELPVVTPPADEPPAPKSEEVKYQPSSMKSDEVTPSQSAPPVTSPTLENRTESMDASTTKPDQPALSATPLVKRQPNKYQPSPIEFERQWETGHQEGEVMQRGSDVLILWNFGVNSDQLKPQHVEALAAFTHHAQIALLEGGVRLLIDGHASRSGSSRRNIDLAIGRANAVLNYLVDQGIPGERCDIDWHSSSKPWFSNMTGGTRARNRRVELQLVGRTTPASSNAPRQVPEPPKHRRAPMQSEPELKLGKMLPGASVEFKKEWDPNYPVMIGPYVVCHPNVEISGKYKLKTEREENLALQFKAGEESAKIQFKKKLNQLTEFKADSSGNIGFGFKGDLVNSELIWDWKKLATKGAPVVYGVSKAFPIPDLEYPQGSGMHWSIEFEIKGKFALGPSAYALQQLGLSAAGSASAGATAAEGVVTGIAAIGAAEAVMLGGVGLGFGLFAFSLYQMAQAGEIGEQRARLFGRHVGFALRLAGEVTGDYGYREALSRLRTGNYYEDYYDGWHDAETALVMSSPLSKERLRRLGEIYGALAIDPFVEVLLRRAGAYDFKALPSNLEMINL